MAITPLDIANMALGVLDEAPVDSLDQDVKPARLLNLHFDLTREAELMKHAWVFAILAAAVAGSDTGSGAGTLNFAYELPVDCLRPLPLTHNGEPDGVPIAWRQEAGLIYCDRPGPLIIRYVANLTDPNDWDATFTEVLVAALAVKIAHPLTHKAGMIDIARGAYSAALDAAFHANAIQRGGRFSTSSWAIQRGDNGSGAPDDDALSHPGHLRPWRDQSAIARPRLARPLPGCTLPLRKLFDAPAWRHPQARRHLFLRRGEGFFQSDAADPVHLLGGPGLCARIRRSLHPRPCLWRPRRHGGSGDTLSRSRSVRPAIRPVRRPDVDHPQKPPAAGSHPHGAHHMDAGRVRLSRRPL